MAQIPKVAAVFAEPLLKRLAETVNAIIDRFLNTPALDEDNTFTGVNTFTGTQIIEAGTPSLILSESDAAADNGVWNFVVQSEQLRFRTLNDAFDTAANWLTVDRTGTTVDAVAFSATAITLNGVSVTDFARLSGGNTFTDNQRISTANAKLWLIDTSAAADSGKWAFDTDTDDLNLYAVDDAEAVFTRILNINRNTTTIVRANFENGELQYGGIEVGYRGTPINTQNGSYTTAPSDSGGTIYKASGGAGETITIDDSDHAVGTMLDVINNGGGTLTIAVDGGASLNWAQTGGTGSRTLADHGWAVLKKVATSTWWISGTGLT